MGKGRNVYFRDESLWDDLERLAEDQDRSVNWIIEDMVREKLNMPSRKEVNSFVDKISDGFKSKLNKQKK